MTSATQFQGRAWRISSEKVNPHGYGQKRSMREGGAIIWPRYQWLSLYSVLRTMYYRNEAFLEQSHRFPEVTQLPQMLSQYPKSTRVVPPESSWHILQAFLAAEKCGAYSRPCCGEPVGMEHCKDCLDSVLISISPGHPSKRA